MVVRGWLGRVPKNCWQIISASLPTPNRLHTLWVTGDFCGVIPQQGRTAHYPYTQTGFYQFLRDHGSQISPEAASRRIKVFRAYNRFEVTIERARQPLFDRQMRPSSRTRVKAGQRLSI
jgi:hypothetical protein